MCLGYNGACSNHLDTKKFHQIVPQPTRMISFLNFCRVRPTSRISLLLWRWRWWFFLKNWKLLHLRAHLQNCQLTWFFKPRVRPAIPMLHFTHQRSLSGNVFVLILILHLQGCLIQFTSLPGGGKYIGWPKFLQLDVRRCGCRLFVCGCRDPLHCISELFCRQSSICS